jgi:hypothetical protein
MFFIEKGLYEATFSDEERKDSERRQREGEAELIRTTGSDKEGNKYWRIDESVSDTPRAPGSLYAQNKRYLDFRTPYDEKRGLITILACCCGGILPLVLPYIVIEIPKILFTGIGPKGTPLDSNDYILVSLFMLVLSFFPLGFIYLAKKFFCLEIFVQRRLLVRFDRVNRKVYLHRPRYAGGIVALDWDKVIVSTYKGPSYIGLPLILTWYAEDVPNGAGETTLLGRNSRDNTELCDRWEFIRRFMEIGPDAVPRQWLIGKTPWPWRSLFSTLGGVWPLFMPSLRFLLLPMLLVLPAALFYAFFNWLSLLLCWEPVFPRAIRKACGESWWRPIQARIIDLLAWTMLAATIWWGWPHVDTYLARIS